MIPFLPPELLYHILESATLPAGDLTRIARSSRSLLPVARKLLYRSIKVYYDEEIGYILLAPNGASQSEWITRQLIGLKATEKERSAAFKKRLSNPLLSPLVKTFRICAEIGASKADNSTLLNDVLLGCSNLEVLVCSTWRSDPVQLAMIVAEVKGDRLKRGQSTELKVHLEATTMGVRQQTDPLDLPLSSFAIGDFDHRFAANYLAGSTASLRALEVNVKDAHLYRDFPNISTLSLFQRHYDHLSLQNAQKLLSTVLHFEHLNTLHWSSYGCQNTADVLLWLLPRLPSTLRSLSLDFDFSPDQAWQLANALPEDTCLKHLNLINNATLKVPPDLDLRTKEMCRRKGVKLTIGEKWNVWDNLCLKAEMSEESFEIA